MLMQTVIHGKFFHVQCEKLMVSHFSVVAGRGVHEGEMATSICKKIFSLEIALQLNWTGTEIKKRNQVTKVWYVHHCQGLITLLSKSNRLKYGTVRYNKDSGSSASDYNLKYCC